MTTPPSQLARIFVLNTLIVLFFSPAYILSAQTLAADAPAPSLPAIASSSATPAPAPAAFVTLPPSAIHTQQTVRPFSQLGVATQIGLTGPGFDLATPLSRRLNLRAGLNSFSFSANFHEQGANVAIGLRLLSAHAALDWFPFNGRFRVSPLLVFANNNRVLATATIPSGSTITLNGQDYSSSSTDPLRGYGRIGFRKLAPGLSIGFGNMLPRKRSRFSIPFELGFYYVGQPTLQVGFAGSACDPSLPANIGCQSVTVDPTFQKNLNAFIARNNHNLRYASFFPILSIGFAYRIW